MLIANRCQETAPTQLHVIFLCLRVFVVKKVATEGNPFADSIVLD